MNRRQVLSIGTVSLAAGLGFVLIRVGYDGNEGYERVRRLLATARRDARLRALDPAPQLDETAHRHARFMFDQDAVSHFGRNGEDPAVRARRTGFEGQVIGEALAETRESPEETMTFWLSHSPTQKVLMAPEAKLYGLAAVTGMDGRVWWDLVTGA